MEESVFSYLSDQKQNLLAMDLKRYCNNEKIYHLAPKYFENKIYEKIGFREDDINSILITRFIQTYHTSKIGNPSINDVRTNIALYGCIKNEKYESLEQLLNTDRIKEFLVRRYIGNFDNNSIDVDTLNETMFLLNGYHNYLEFKNNKSIIKEKKMLR